MTPRDLINAVFMLLLKRPATDEEVTEATALVNRIITEMEQQ